MGGTKCPWGFSAPCRDEVSAEFERDGDRFSAAIRKAEGEFWRAFDCFHDGLEPGYVGDLVAAELALRNGGSALSASVAQLDLAGASLRETRERFRRLALDDPGHSVVERDETFRSLDVGELIANLHQTGALTDDGSLFKKAFNKVSGGGMVAGMQELEGLVVAAQGRVELLQGLTAPLEGETLLTCLERIHNDLGLQIAAAHVHLSRIATFACYLQTLGAACSSARQPPWNAGSERAPDLTLQAGT